MRFWIIIWHEDITLFCFFFYFRLLCLLDSLTILVLFLLGLDSGSDRDEDEEDEETDESELLDSSEEESLESESLEDDDEEESLLESEELELLFRLVLIFFFVAASDILQHSSKSIARGKRYQVQITLSWNISKITKMFLLLIAFSTVLLTKFGLAVSWHPPSGSCSALWFWCLDGQIWLLPCTRMSSGRFANISDTWNSLLKVCWNKI